MHVFSHVCLSRLDRRYRFVENLAWWHQNLLNLQSILLVASAINGGIFAYRLIHTCQDQSFILDDIIHRTDDKWQPNPPPWRDSYSPEKCDGHLSNTLAIIKVSQAFYDGFYDAHGQDVICFTLIIELIWICLSTNKLQAKSSLRDIATISFHHI